jgi:hypothetical protein
MAARRTTRNRLEEREIQTLATLKAWKILAWVALLAALAWAGWRNRGYAEGLVDGYRIGHAENSR